MYVVHRDVTRGSQFPVWRITMATQNHCGGRRKVSTMVWSTFFSSIFAYERSQVRTCGRQTYLVPLSKLLTNLLSAPSNLITPLILHQNLLSDNFLDTDSKILTKIGFGSDTDIIFQKQDRIG